MHKTANPWGNAQGCRECPCEKISVEGTILITWILAPYEMWTHQTYFKFLSLSQIVDIKLSASPVVIIHSLPNIPNFETDPCFNPYFANLLSGSVSIGLRAYPCPCLLSYTSALRWETDLCSWDRLSTCLFVSTYWQFLDSSSVRSSF